MGTPLAIAGGSLLLTVVAGALPAFLALTAKLPPERSMLPSFLLHTAVFCVGASFGAARGAFWLLIAADLILLAAVVHRLRREPGAWRRFATPRTAAAWCFLALSGALTMPRRFALWDEFSHWGPAARLLFEYGKLNCAFPMLSHGSYPPGLPAAVNLTIRCFAFPHFSEAAALFATGGFFITLCLIDLMPTETEAAEEKRATPRFGFLSSAALFLALNFILDLSLPAVSRSAMADAALAALFAAGLRRVFSPRPPNAWDGSALVLITGFLPMVKDAGLLCAVMIQALYLLRRSGAPRGAFPRPELAVLLAAPWIAKLFWTIQLRIWDTAIRFPAERFAPATVLAAFSSPDGGWRMEMLRAFALRSRQGSLPLLVVVLAALWFRRKHDPATPRLLAAIPICWLVFAAGLAGFYCFGFSVAEARSLASFDRYQGGFAAAWLLAAAATVAAETPPPGPRWEKRAAVAAGAAAALLALLWGWSCRMAYSVWYYRMGYIDRLTDLDAQRILRAYGPLLTAPGATFRLVESAGGGESTFRFTYYAPFNFDRHRIFYPRRTASPEEPNAVRMTPEELFAYGSACRYLLAGRVDERFLRDYGELFPGLTAAGCRLYEKDPERPGRFRPVAAAAGADSAGY